MSDETKPGESDASSENTSEAADEAKSLTDLLKEWDDDSTSVQADDKKSDDDKQDTRMARLEARESQRDMDALVQKVKGDLDVDDWIVQAWVLNEAANNPKMDKLWDDRENRQADLNKIVSKALIPGFKKYAEDKILPPTDDADKTNDKKSASSKLGAAVRGARDSKVTTGSGLDDVDWGSLSDSEFEAKKQEVFKKAAAGELTK